MTEHDDDEGMGTKPEPGISTGVAVVLALIVLALFGVAFFEAAHTEDEPPPRCVEVVFQ